MSLTFSSETIDVSDVRIGMFIHLDGGWMSHPFPLSSFKITSQDQLAALRATGLSLLRWSPEQSDSDAPPAAAQPEPTDPSEHTPEQVEARARRAHRDMLSAERLALAACERQFGEAVRASRQVFDGVVVQPDAARQGAQALVGQLVDKMVSAEDMCIRLLSEGAGDRANAMRSM